MKKTFTYSAKVFILMISLFVLVFTVELYAQEADSTDTPQLVQNFMNGIKPGVRSTALGGASVADYRELSSIFINPATLSFVRNLKRIEFNTSQSWENNLMLQNISLPFFANQRHSIAAQTGVMHSGLESANPFVSGAKSKPDITLYRFDLAYAYSLTSYFSMGILSSTSIADNAYSNEITNVLSIGMIYVPSKSISYGISFRGLGRNIGYELPESGRTKLITQNTNESLEVGATLTYPVDTDRSYFSLSLANEKRFGEPGIWYKAGVEAKFFLLKKLPQLQLRNGLIMKPESDIYAPTFGVGMDWSKTSVSFSISPGKQLSERFHQLGIIIYFD